MSKKIVVVNAGPRMGWNTETLITEAAKGAESAGADIKRLIYSGWIGTQAAFPVLVVRKMLIKAVVSAKMP